MVYDFAAAHDWKLLQVGEVAQTAGSPAAVFGQDADTFAQGIEDLHQRGWLRYETTHNLDQIRLRRFTSLEFLTAHFEGRGPREGTEERTPTRALAGDACSG